jgi:hypothetical protein
MAPISLTFWIVVTQSETITATDGSQPNGQPGPKALRLGEALGCTE